MAEGNNIQRGTLREGQLTPESLAAYHEHGHLLLPQLVPREDLEALRDEVSDCWRRIKGEDSYHEENTWLQNALFPDIHHYSPLARKYYWNSPLLGVLGQLIGPNVKGSTTQLTFKVCGNTKNFEWHQDNGYGHLSPYNSATSLLALDDVTVEPVDNGCLRIVPGSHKRGQIGKALTAKEKTDGVQIEIDVEGEGVPAAMRAGDVLIFHCHMVHRSMGNFSDGDRRILFCRFSDADAVEIYNESKPRLGRLLMGESKFPEVTAFEADLPFKQLPAPAEEPPSKKLRAE
mmetsp:Transcript_13521/g.26617  ORF Transcript_13521/g.26617 Transcript_13521/m.26617 type:complete len:288 (+) Transcript_13521:24-887(+)